MFRDERVREVVIAITLCMKLKVETGKGRPHHVGLGFDR